MTGLLNKGGLFSNKHKRVASIKNKKLKGHLVEHEYYSGIANCQARITAIFLVIFWTLEIFKFMYLFHDFRGTPQDSSAESWVSVEPRFGNRAVQYGHSATSVFSII